MRSSTRLGLALAVLLVPALAADALAAAPACGEPGGTVTLGLGAASGYNVFAFVDLFAANDVEGAVAAGGTVYADQFSLGHGATTEDVLVAGRGFALTNGTLHGSAWYGWQALVEGVSFLGGSAKQGAPLDFAAARAQLTARSMELAAVTATASVTVSAWGEISLTGTDPTLNVFEMEGVDFVGATSLQLDVPDGAISLVNVSGVAVNLRAVGMDLGPGGPQRVLFNLHQAVHMTMRTMQFSGSVLAPFAQVFREGAFDGTLIARRIWGSGTFFDSPFEGGLEVPMCGPELPEGTCEVTWQASAPWPWSEGVSAYEGGVTFTWDGPATSDWTLAYSFAGDDTIVESWGGTVWQSGPDTEISSVDWNAVLMPGATVETGFIATFSGALGQQPSGFALNGVECSIAP